uniref:Uncharacterized protein n=2 Tax=Anguilla anguilla TaxID=7936 RepID=A0A0E9VAS2_ANGAN
MLQHFLLEKNASLITQSVGSSLPKHLASSSRV